MGGHRVNRCGFYDGASVGRSVEGYSFLLVFVQLQRLVLSSPFDPSVV